MSAPRRRIPLNDPFGPTRATHTPVVESAGAVVWRVRDGVLQVRLIHRPRYDDWSWPKGKLDPGEATQTAAAREVAEETGKPVVLGVPLPGLQYLLADGSVKRVHYWAARRARGSKGPRGPGRAGPDGDTAALAARVPVAPVSPDEIDDMAWLDVATARRRLTRPADRGPLDALVREHEHGRLDTHAVVIARHGKAVPRSAWCGQETDRPLTPLGHAQAAALVPVLAAYGTGSLVTSAWERCARTLDPYARATGVVPESLDQLTEAQHERSPERVARAVESLVEEGRSAVLCTHRPVLSTVLDALRGSARAPVARALPDKDPYLAPGELLVAHVATTSRGPRVVAAERVTPPVW